MGDSVEQWLAVPPPTAIKFDSGPGSICVEFFQHSPRVLAGFFHSPKTCDVNWEMKLTFFTPSLEIESERMDLCIAVDRTKLFFGNIQFLVAVPQVTTVGQKKKISMTPYCRSNPVLSRHPCF